MDVGGGRCILFAKMIQVRDGDSNRARAVLRSVEKLSDTTRKACLYQEVYKTASVTQGIGANSAGSMKCVPFSAKGNAPGSLVKKPLPVATSIVPAGAVAGKANLDESVVVATTLGDPKDGLPKGKFQRAFLRPTVTTLTSVCFTIGDGSGIRMTPKESWVFEIPKSYHSCNVLTVVLAHRKPSEDANLMESYVDEHDKEGAYTLVQVQKPDGGLVSWMDGSRGVKFAEPRPKDDPEEENLHDWLLYRGRIQCAGVVLTGKGVGERGVAHIHKLIVEFEPPFSMHALQEKIFTIGSTFMRIDQTGRFDPKSRVIYGGGPDAPGNTLDRIISRGVYPGSVTLGVANKDASEDFGHGIRLVKGRLHVSLIASKVFLMIEISCGDTIFDKAFDAEKKNKDGHYGRLGWAKLYARLANQERFIMWNVNVPPNAVLRGGASELEGHVCLDGEEIVIESRYCSTFVMGVRVIYK